MSSDPERNWILKAESLLLKYGRNIVLKDVSFELTQGECLTIMGSSGCGKSTLLKSMVGLLRPSSGNIEFRNGFTLGEVGFAEPGGCIQFWGSFSGKCLFGAL